MKEIWKYDICSEDWGICVADSEDQEFATREEALADAHDYIISDLSKEYETSFYVECYSMEVPDEEI